jgi:hypothetical protein
MERGPGPFGIESLASLGYQRASIGSLPPLLGRDGFRSSVSTQHFADVVMQIVPDPESRASRRSETGPSLPCTKRKRSKTSKFVGSSASADALEVRVVTRTFSDGRTDGRSDDGRGGVRDLDAL